MYPKIDIFKQIEVKYDETIDSYRVYIHTPLYILKVRELSHTYSTAWTPSAIVEDVLKYHLRELI